MEIGTVGKICGVRKSGAVRKSVIVRGRLVSGGAGFIASHVVDALIASGYEVTIVARPGEQRRSVLDARRAERVLGWKASTSLTDGLRLTVQDARG